MSGATALEVRGLEAGYDDAPVLRGLDLTVTSGVTAILGPSGCGKTTLLRSIAGFVRPTAGSIGIAGTEVVGPRGAVPARRRGVGFVPQDGALFPHLSVTENVAFGLPRAERRAAGDRVAAMLDLVELPSTLARRSPHELSGGQQQRVALARALAPRPALVLLDEPFSSLDASLREETGRSVVRALEAAGAAALLVTHDQGEALSLADQVAVMLDGRFLQVAPPAAVYLTPSDARVAAFIGRASLLDGDADGEGAVRCALGVVRGRPRPGGSPPPAGPVRVAVRAEQVELGDPAAGGAAGEVTEVSFYGHDATVRVRLDAGGEVTARTTATAVPTSGERVAVSVAGDVVVFAG